MPSTPPSAAAATVIAESRAGIRARVHRGTSHPIRAALLEAALRRAAGRPAGELDALNVPPSAPDALIASLGRTMASPAMAPHARLWTGVVSRADAGSEYAAPATAIVDRFLAWASDPLEAGTTDPEGAAAYVLCAVDGLLLMTVAGRPEVADAATRWAGARGA